MKTCTKCGTSRDVAEFPLRQGRPGSWCKPCQYAAQREWVRQNPDKKRLASRRWEAEHPEQTSEISARAVRIARLRRYSITQDDYDAMLAAQGGCCAICRRPEPCGTGTWHIDHDHGCCPGQASCGACVRGLLCLNCNHMLGRAGDDPDVLHAAVQYLEQHASARSLNDDTPEGLVS